jgi:hypothetical protein
MITCYWLRGKRSGSMTAPASRFRLHPSSLRGEVGEATNSDKRTHTTGRGKLEVLIPLSHAEWNRIFQIAEPPAQPG